MQITLSGGIRRCIRKYENNFFTSDKRQKKASPSRLGAKIFIRMIAVSSLVRCIFCAKLSDDNEMRGTEKKSFPSDGKSVHKQESVGRQGEDCYKSPFVLLSPHWSYDCVGVEKYFDLIAVPFAAGLEQMGRSFSGTTNSSSMTHAPLTH